MHYAEVYNRSRLFQEIHSLLAVSNLLYKNKSKYRTGANLQLFKFKASEVTHYGEVYNVSRLFQDIHSLLVASAAKGCTIDFCYLIIDHYTTRQIRYATIYHTFYENPAQVLCKKGVQLKGVQYSMYYICISLAGSAFS